MTTYSSTIIYVCDRSKDYVGRTQMLSLALTTYYSLYTGIFYSESRIISSLHSHRLVVYKYDDFLFVGGLPCHRMRQGQSKQP